jgi:hypothetical protein
MLKKKKLKIENLKIESFTTEKLNDVKGGRQSFLDSDLPVITSDSSHLCCVQNDNT